MKIYKVKVNGKVYEVELEEIRSTGEVTKKAAPSKNTDIKMTEREGMNVVSFMQGVIVDIKVEEGQNVKEGSTVAVLEAMKMSNEIVAPVSGTVSKIFVKRQDTVENQEVIMIIK